MPDWPHAPIHRLEHGGAFMVTSGTYRKEHLFGSPDRLALVQDTLFVLADELNWRLQAWAIFSNHYHFVAMSPDNASSLRMLIKRLHGSTAVAVNRMDGVAGRKVAPILREAPDLRRRLPSAPEVRPQQPCAPRLGTCL